MTEDVSLSESAPAVDGSTAVVRGRNPARVYLDSLRSERSRETQERALVMVLRELRPNPQDPVASIDVFPWHALRAEHARWINAKLSSRTPPYAPATLRRLLVAMRRVFHASWDLGYIDAETRDRCSAFPAVRGKSPPAGAEVDADDVERLFAVCDVSTPKGARGAAALALLFGGGLRRAEAVEVAVGRYDPKHRTVGVLGKGGRYRTVPMGEWSLEINRWLAVRGHSAGPILCRVDQRGQVSPSKRITPTRLYEILAEIGQRASPPVEFSPHDARRTAITRLLRSKVDLHFVQRFAGHESPVTTSAYDRRPEEEMFAAVESAGRSASKPR